MENLDQLLARSTREIEAHATELGLLESSRYFIEQPAQLLAALRLWAQSQYRSDQVVRDVLEANDVIAPRAVADELRQLGTIDGETAGWAIAEIAKRSSGELMVIAGYAVRAL